MWGGGPGGHMSGCSHKSCSGRMGAGGWGAGPLVLDLRQLARCIVGPLLLRTAMQVARNV